MIDRIRIQNFRSLIDVDVNLEPLTVLIGRSGTGKSNFVGAVRMLRDLLLSRGQVPLDGVAPLSRPTAPLTIIGTMKYGGISGLEYSLTIGSLLQNSGGIGFPGQIIQNLGGQPVGILDEWLKSGNQTLFQQRGNKWIVEPKVQPRPQVGLLCLGSLSGIREATLAFGLLSRGLGCYDYSSNVLQVDQHVQNQMFAGNIGLGPAGVTTPLAGFLDSGQNYIHTASAILDDIDRANDWNAITDTMRSLNGAVRSIDLTLPQRDKLQVGYQVGDKIMLMDVAAESEGFRRYLATLLALYQAPSKQTLIFEHPENGIHPGALETLANEFKRHVKKGRGQIILTTHSPQLLDHFEPEQIRVVDIVNQETKIGPLSPEQKEALRDNLLKPGELLTVDPARLAGQLAEVPG